MFCQLPASGFHSGNVFKHLAMRWQQPPAQWHSINIAQHENQEIVANATRDLHV